ncbi:MAG: hypothetical protein JSV86_17050 [Gemmatimonadota bacterium]|nr:MAG: hypothetical protein JSV86_17050 [Gemmatimonadota bacterium]
MALTAALVESTPYRLRYLITSDGVVTSPSDPDVDALIVIPNDGGGTPDLQTDASPGPLDQIINVRANGYGPIPAGAITQAQARALLASEDNVVAPVVLTNDLVGRAVCEVTGRTGRLSWSCDANIDGQGDPTIEVRCTAGVVGTGYLDVYFRHTYDL